MRVLLDTHLVLWALAAPERLPGAAHRLIERADGVYIYDSEGRRILDGMAGLCRFDRLARRPNALGTVASCTS